jgi:hypothetical protein
MWKIRKDAILRIFFRSEMKYVEVFIFFLMESSFFLSGW